MHQQDPEIILGITGSIAAYKAADLIHPLREAGFGVTCVMTPCARQFVGAATLQALSGRKVYTELFDSQAGEIVHTALADRAKVVLVAPATAHLIGKLSQGLADDLLSCILLATRAKIIMAPAMNVHMWQHPHVQQNVKKLTRLGVVFVGPDTGKLACGYEGVGHFADLEVIVRQVRQALPKRPKRLQRR